MDPINNDNRRAVGSIIGGVFLILIFTSIMTTLIIIENNKQEMEILYEEREQFDTNKQIEELEYLSIQKKPNNYLNISVINSGNIGTDIVYVGEINETDPQREKEFHRVNLFLNPLETMTDISGNTIRVSENDTKRIMLLTSYGNMYLYLYNNKQDGGSGGQTTSYDLTISVNGNGSTIPGSGIHSYSESSAVDVFANPDLGWSFSHWTLDSSPAGSENPITISMNGDHELEAVFTQGMVTLLVDNFDNLDNWGGTDWEIVSDEYHSIGTSARSVFSNRGDLQSNNLDTSMASQLHIVFWYRLSGGVDATDVDVMLYDGLGGPDIVANLYGQEDIWRLFNYTTTDSQYFISDFYIRFNSAVRSSETVWIDDLTITYIP